MNPSSLPDASEATELVENGFPGLSNNGESVGGVAATGRRSYVKVDGMFCRIFPTMRMELADDRMRSFRSAQVRLRFLYCELHRYEMPLTPTDRAVSQC
jgi:hypothetical protein